MGNNKYWHSQYLTLESRSTAEFCRYISHTGTEIASLVMDVVF